MKFADISRRDVLRGTAAFGIASMLPNVSGAAGGRRKRVRVAHLTDMHIQPELHAGSGVEKCLHHVNSLKDKPSLILTGGDHVMDAMGQTRSRTKVQWDLHNKVWKSENSIPIHSCIGNHDVWGWNKKGSGTTGDEMDYGKKSSVEMLGIPKAYYSFEHQGWNFIVLDSIFPHDSGYIGRLDDEQFEWLTQEVSRAKKPTLVLSHIPILSVTTLLTTDSVADIGGDHKINVSEMHADSPRIVALFKKNPQIKVAISGHIHYVDRVEANGMTYLCNGAVSGNWWMGNRYGMPPGYAVLDLFEDGSVERSYIPWGWSKEA